MDKRPPLHLHLLAHPKSKVASELAEALMRRFVEPPVSGGLRIPVFFTPDNGSDLPPQLVGSNCLDLDAAQHTIIVVLADDIMLRTIRAGTGNEWTAFAKQAIELAPLDMSNHHILPVALELAGFGISDVVHVLPALVKDAESTTAQSRRLAIVSFHIAARAIQLLEHGKVPALAPGRMQAPVSIFLSHAKADLDKENHDDPVRHTRALLNELPVEQWFDAQNIATSQQFADAISAGIRDCSIMLAFHTDHYNSRPWCQREVLEAKRFGAHTLVVDALHSGEPRNFPYGGNVPTVRWQFSDAPQTDAWQVIDRAVLEALRLKHNRALLEQTAAPHETILPTAPEALTLAHQGGEEGEEENFLYPDPPLGRDELKVLQQLRPNARFVTPLTKIARRLRPDHLKTITASISESDDLQNYGLSLAHMHTLTDEIFLYLLLAGLKIAYGGALKGTLSKESNLTQRLFELVRTYSKLAEDVNSLPLEYAIINVAPWPLWLSYGEPELNLFEGKVAELKEEPHPELPWNDDELFPLTESGRIIASDTPERRYAWSRGLTRMRNHITELSEARLVIGGKLKNFSGLIPGVVEETWLSLTQKKPLYLIGGFGGAARAVVDLLSGKQRPEFSNEWSEQFVPDYDAALSLYGQHGGDLRTLEHVGSNIATNANTNLASVFNNGLSESENHKLLYCSDPQRIAQLVLTGLSRL